MCMQSEEAGQECNDFRISKTRKTLLLLRYRVEKAKMSKIASAEGT